MSRSKKSNNGFKGKIGKIVTYQLKGQTVERMVGEITTPPSVLQLANRQRTKLITDLLRPVMGYIRIGFKNATQKGLLSPYNLATTLNRQNAIKGEYPNMEIDFEKAVFSKGNLPMSDNLHAAEKDYGVEFSWDNSLLYAGMSAYDPVMVLAICPAQNCAFSLTTGAIRKDGAVQLNLPRYKKKTVFHTYISFVSGNEKRISDSVYLGSFLQ